MLILMMAMAGLGYWYYNDTQEKIAILHENNAKLEIAVHTQKAAIEQTRNDLKRAHIVSEATMKKFTAARVEVDSLSRKFNKVSKLLGARDFGKIAITKPGPIKKIINKGSNKMMRCFEILSGQPLTDKEKNAEKKSQINTMCPNVANPNYAPSR